MLTFLILLGVILLGSFFIVWTIYSVITNFTGAPFVPSTNKELKEVFDSVEFKKGSLVYDLGSGDGKVLRMLVKKYGVKGVGIELNPALFFYSIFLTKLLKIKNLTFKRTNLFHESLEKADVVYVFLLIRTLEKLEGKIIKECKKGTMVISHGFTIKGLKSYLVKTIKGRVFPTYIYILK